MKITPHVSAPRPHPAFKDQMPFLGPVALAIRSFKGVKAIWVDRIAWQKLNTLNYRHLRYFRNVEIFLRSRQFTELGLQYYRPPKTPSTLYLMGEAENIKLIDKLNPHDHPKLPFRKHSNLIDDRHNS